MSKTTGTQSRNVDDCLACKSPVKGAAATRCLSGRVSGTSIDMKKQTSIRNTAMNLLARREHSATELLQKLKQREHAEEDILKAIEELQADNLQSDARFAESFINQRVNAGYGPSKNSTRIKDIRGSMRIWWILISSLFMATGLNACRNNGYANLGLKYRLITRQK